MLGSAALYAVCFSSFGLGKKLFGDKSPLQLFNAGCFSGVFSTVVMTPMELVKVQLQIQKDGVKKYNGAFDCGKKIYQEMGLKGIYKGTMATLARDVPGSGVYFAAYEIVKRAFIPVGGTSADLNSFHTLFAGGMAGLTGWIYMLPADTIKSRIQSAEPGQYSGMMDCVRQLIKNEGYGALYRGIGPVFLRSFPANAACFWGFETAMNILNKISN
jgi:solute carrier family 25 (mitochondrial carnitine/acylcarnitine transporter), member 20/29